MTLPVRTQPPHWLKMREHLSASAKQVARRHVRYWLDSYREYRGTDPGSAQRSLEMAAHHLFRLGHGSLGDSMIAFETHRLTRPTRAK